VHRIELLLRPFCSSTCMCMHRYVCTHSSESTWLQTLLTDKQDSSYKLSFSKTHLASTTEFWRRIRSISCCTPCPKTDTDTETDKDTHTHTHTNQDKPASAWFRVHVCIRRCMRTSTCHFFS
jgi:hypothetical protein